MTAPLEWLGEPSLVGAILAIALDLAAIFLPWIALAILHREASHNMLASAAPFVGIAMLYLVAFAWSASITGRTSSPISYELFSPAIDVAVDLAGGVIAGALMWLLPRRAEESAVTV